MMKKIHFCLVLGGLMSLVPEIDDYCFCAAVDFSASRPQTGTRLDFRMNREESSVAVSEEEFANERVQLRTTENDNSLAPSETEKPWNIQFDYGTSRDISFIESVISPLYQEGSRFLSFFYPEAHRDSFRSVAIAVENNPGRPAVEFIDGRLCLNRPDRWKADGSIARNLSSGGASEPSDEWASERRAVRKSFFEAILYGQGLQNVFSPELISGLSDCFANPGPVPVFASGSPRPDRIPDLPENRLRFALYGCDGALAGDILQRLSDQIILIQEKNGSADENNTGEPSVLVPLWVPGGGTAVGERIPATKFTLENRDSGRFGRQSHAALQNQDALAPGSQMMQNDHELCGLDDVLDLENYRNLYSQWRQNPEYRTPAIRFSRNLAGITTDQLPTEVLQMATLLKLLGRYDISLLEELPTPATFNHTNYKESLNSKPVQTIVKTMPGIGRELQAQKVDNASYVLTLDGDLTAISGAEDWSKTFTQGQDFCQIGQDELGGFLVSRPIQGARYRLRWIEEKEESGNGQGGAASQNGSTVTHFLPKSAEGKPVILLEKLPQD